MTRALRVGVLLGDQLVEERVFTSRAPITFGQSLRCVLSVPTEDAPREHVLFTFDGSHWRLHATSAMTVVEQDRHGKVTIGDATILFQEIAAPPPAPRPQLPAAIRGTLADRIDRRLAMIIGGSLLVHVAIASWAWLHDIDDRPLGMPSVATYREEIIDVTLPDLTPAPPTTTETPGVAAPVAPRQTPRPIVQKQIATGADAQRLASILTNDDATETGQGGMSPRQPGADLNKQIDDARNRKIAIGDGTQTSRVDDSAHVDDRHRQLVTNPQRVETAPRRDEDSRERIQIGPIKPETRTSLTPALVLDWINTRYMVGLRRCYRIGLNDDSTLSGRVGISFTVDDRGHVIDADASGMGGSVDACISKQMSSWRFPIPKDKNGAATDASFAVSLALQPS